MISRMWFPVAVFLGGLACIAAAVATGEADVELVLVFPVFSGSSGLFLIGTALIVLSFLIVFAMMATARGESYGNTVAPTASQAPKAEGKTHYGGVVLIGPIPIAFGSSKKVALVMLVLGIAMAVVLASVLLMLG